MAAASVVLAVMPALASVAEADPSSGTTTTTSETTIGYSALRQNWDGGEPGLTSLDVGQPGFGQLWDKTVPGTTTATPNQIYAQPIVADGHVVIATEENTATAYDPATGAQQWSANLGPSWTPTPTCGDLVPHIGITSTPVYDASTHTVYLIAKAADGTGGDPTIKIHALDAATGQERPGWPVTIGGTSTNGGRTFNPATSNQRPGLLLGDDGALYFGLASHCDNGPFVGFVGRIALGTRSLKLWTTDQDDANGQAGIWQSGGGIMSDGDDANGHPRLFVATGNGLESAPGTGPGNRPPSHLSESVIRLQVNPDGSLSAADFFSPVNNQRLDLDDSDLGSGAPVALPDDYGSSAHPHLLVIAGKDGVVRLLDRDNLGGVGQGTNAAGAADGSDADVSSTPGRGVWGHAAVFDAGAGRHYVYLSPAEAPMQVLSVSPDANGVPTVTQAAATSDVVHFGSGSPIVTSDGSDSSTALVWDLQGDGSSGANGRLVAYPAIPSADGTWTPQTTIYLQHPIAKFTQPATADGRLFVGTRDGHVLAFGLGSSSPLAAPATDFGQVAVNGSRSTSVTITATSSVTITGVSAAAPFSAGAPTPTLPVTLNAGGTRTVPVTFRPTSAGTSSGIVTVTTRTGSYLFSLRGTGTSNGFAALPSQLAFGQVATGQGAAQGLTIQNTGASTATISSVSLTAADGTSPANSAFTISSGTPSNYSLAAQASVSVIVTVHPTGVGPLTGDLIIRGSTGTTTVPLSGTAYQGQPVLGVVPAALDFGQIQPGGLGVKSFQVTNCGNGTLEITKAAVPAAPFAVASPFNEGQQIAPGTGNQYPNCGTAYQQVQVRPTSAMPYTDAYSISAAPAQGSADLPAGDSPQKVALTVNTAPWTGSIAGKYGCVTISGSAPSRGATAVNGRCAGGSQSQFTRTSDGRYHLGTATSPWCLAVAKYSTRPGSVVVLSACASGSTTEQRWLVAASGTLVDARSRLCLRTERGATAAGTRLVIDTCTTSLSERWDVSALLSARGLVSSGLGPIGSYCLSDRADSRSAGTPAVLTGCTFASGQIITHVSNTLKVYGACLTVRVPKSSSGVLLEQCNGSAAQVWTTDATNRLYNPASRLCLDDPARTASGTAVSVATCNSTKLSQRWTLPDSR